MELDARTKGTFDLSEFAPEARDETANDAVVFLYEVLMRLELPPLSEIPGDAEIEEGLDLESWTLPHTEITVHRVFEGPRQGEYLFSPDTVERAEEFYERVKLLPYKTSPRLNTSASSSKSMGAGPFHFRGSTLCLRGCAMS